MKTVRDIVEEFKGRKGAAFVDRREFRTFRYSYADLDRLVRQMVSFLRSRKVGKGDTVMIWAPNSVEYAVSVLAIMAWGAVAVPIDVRQTADFFDKVRGQVKPKLIIHSRIRPVDAKNAVLVEDLHWLLAEQAQSKLSPLLPDDLAQLMYTSGTTGDPKGVMLTHENILFDVSAALKTQSVDRRDVFLSLLPLSHIFEQVVDLFIPLVVGASVVYLESIKPSSIFTALRSERVSRCAVVPRILELFKNRIVDAIGQQRAQDLLEHHHSFRSRMVARRVRRRFSRIRFFYCGGAPLSADLELFFERLGLPVVQGYGLTETTGILATNSVDERKMGSVGRPLPGVHVKIAPGGEILVKGRSVTPGYYKNAKASNAVFSKGWFHTGDIGRMQGGRLFLLGRSKEVIVTSAGVKVYPSDVESVLRSVEGVRDAAVIGHKRGSTEKVYAFLLFEDDVRKTMTIAKKVVEQANARLDSAQQISGFEIWKGADFPRTTTLKVKKQLLVAKKSGSKSRELVAGSKVKEVLMQMTAKKITPKSTLVSLGLSSIDRVDLLNRLEQEFAVDFDDNMIAGDMTVEGLESYVSLRKTADKREVIKYWSLSWLMRTFRLVSQELALLPIVRFFGTPHVRGAEHLDKLDGPAFFVANHQSHLDVPIILMALPWRVKHKLAIGVWQQFFFDIRRRFHGPLARVSYYMTLTFWNGFPFSQRKWFRRSARHAGWLIDRGWNIMLFPEGIRSVDGKIGTFRGAIGLFAKEMRIPIVPIRIEEVDDMLPIGRFFPRFIRPRVVIGEPITITNESAPVATKRIEAVIRSLL